MHMNERLSDGEFAQLKALLHRFAEHDIDQFENLRFDTSYGPVFIAMTRQLPPGWPPEAFTHVLTGAPSPREVPVASEEAPADGMHVAIRLRHDFVITDAGKLLAAARAAYAGQNRGCTGQEADESVTAVADVVFTILEKDGLVGDAAEATLALHAGDGLKPGGWRAQVTVNELRPLPAGPDCLQYGDVFALPPGA